MNDIPDLTWDEAKRRAKHGLDFADAVDIDWDFAFSHDDAFSWGEYRWVAVAPLGDDLVTIVGTDHGTEVRLISMRHASPAEIKLWKEEFYA